MELTVRDATPDDAADCALVYAPYVLDTSVTFETLPPSTAEMRGRISAALAGHAWVVAVADGALLGYAGANAWKTRPAYARSCEVGVYVEAAARHRGVGTALYRVLLDRLAARGFVTAVAGIAQPNPVSTALHRSLGFEEIGTLRRIGFKHGRWLDVTLHQRHLG